jgi:hypothetical protein
MNCPTHHWDCKSKDDYEDFEIKRGELETT